MHNISIDHVMFMTSLSRAQIYSMERDRLLPPRQPLSAARGVWRQEHICAWMQDRLNTNRLHKMHTITLVDRSDHFITKKQLVKIVRISAPTILEMEIAGTFPSRIKITKTRVGWLHREITNWLAAQETPH